MVKVDLKSKRVDCVWYKALFFSASLQRLLAYPVPALQKIKLTLNIFTSIIDTSQKLHITFVLILSSHPRHLAMFRCKLSLTVLVGYSYSKEGRFPHWHQIVQTTILNNLVRRHVTWVYYGISEKTAA